MLLNKSYHETYEAAASELESLLQEQSRIEDRILALRKSMNALAYLISTHDPNDKDFLDHANARLREIVDTSVTADIRRILAASESSLTTSDVRDELNKLGGSLAEQSNPLATINAVLHRLTEQGQAAETLKDGRKAWKWLSPRGIRPVTRASRAWLKADHEIAEISAERARQKYNIVIHQQVDLWNSLEQEAISAVIEINNHGKMLLRFTQLKRSPGFIIETTRLGIKVSAKVEFKSDSHLVIVTCSTLPNEKLRYIIQANDDNRAEFAGEQDHKSIPHQEIISLLLAHLR